MDLEKLIDQTQCPRLNEKYKGIAALPLDLPRFNLDNEEDFWQRWKEQSQRAARQNIDLSLIHI